MSKIIGHEPSLRESAWLRTALSLRARQMLIYSAPDDITGEEGCGVELNTGADYAVAKSLVSRGLGHNTGPGGSLPGMYWSNAYGLQARTALLSNRKDGSSPKNTEADNV